ncbi:MAG: antitoxin VapB family protein [Verrucomicrobia bacterium]|nr:antitoxin VapB family protein [Verrucomicrobiota bacterium]
MSKNISVDDEAYKILKSHKNEDDSFSDVIKRQMALALSGPELVEAMVDIYRPKQKQKGKQHEPAR